MLLRHESRAWHDDADVDLRDTVIVLLGQFARRTRKEMQLLIESNSGQVRSGSLFLKAAAAIGINPFQYAYPHTYAYFYSPPVAAAAAAAAAVAAAASSSSASKRKRPVSAVATPSATPASIQAYVKRQMAALKVDHPFHVTDRILAAVQPNHGSGAQAGYSYLPYSLADQPGALDDVQPAVPYYDAPSKPAAAKASSSAAAAGSNSTRSPLRGAAVASSGKFVEALPDASAGDAVTHVLVGYVAPDDIASASVYDVLKRMPWIHVVNEQWLEDRGFV
jgi:hypothetical protein